MAESQDAFARILNRMQEADTGVAVKTASAPADAPTPAERMLSTVRTISSAVKTAAVAPAVKSTPVASLELMAKEAQEAEQVQLLKQAQFMGAAVADGFMERFAQYDAALSEQGVKTASAPNAAVLQKVAETAYGQAVQDMEKKAAAEFDQGYNDQVQEIHKIAADVHYIGQQTASHLIQEARTAK